MIETVAVDGDKEVQSLSKVCVDPCFILLKFYLKYELVSE